MDSIILAAEEKLKAIKEKMSLTEPQLKAAKEAFEKTFEFYNELLRAKEKLETELAAFKRLKAESDKLNQ